MEFHGILYRSKVPWNSMELFPHSRVPWNSMEFHGTFNFPPKSSMEFHGIPWNFFWSSMEFHGIPWNLVNFIFKKIIFLNTVFGIWLMIRRYLAKISQKRYKLHWFQYRNSYFEHPSVSENGTRSAKMACCLIMNAPKSGLCLEILINTQTISVNIVLLNMFTDISSAPTQDFHNAMLFGRRSNEKYISHVLSSFVDTWRCFQTTQISRKYTKLFVTFKTVFQVWDKSLNMDISLDSYLYVRNTKPKFLWLSLLLDVFARRHLRNPIYHYWFSLIHQK